MTETIDQTFDPGDDSLAMKKVAAGKLACLALLNEGGAIVSRVYFQPGSRKNPDDMGAQLAGLLYHIVETSEQPLTMHEITPEEAQAALDSAA